MLDANGSCNTVDDLSGKMCVPNTAKDASLNIFKMTTKINESKTLTKHISCECKCKLDGKKFDSVYDK